MRGRCNQNEVDDGVSDGGDIVVGKLKYGRVEEGYFDSANWKERMSIFYSGIFKGSSPTDRPQGLFGCKCVWRSNQLNSVAPTR